MNNLNRKLPYILIKIADFFFNAGNYFLRDFQEMPRIMQKEKFTTNTLKKFRSNLDAQTFSADWKIFVDGIEFFAKGLPHVCFVAQKEDTFLIYEPIIGVYYWYYENVFWHNGNRVQISPDKKIYSSIQEAIDSGEVLNLVPLPSALALAWFLSGSLDLLPKNEQWDTFLSNYTLCDGYYLQQNLIISEPANSLNVADTNNIS